MVQATFGASYPQHQAQARQFQAAPAPIPLASQGNTDNFINDFDFSRLTNLGMSGLGQLTGQLKTMLPASGNVVTDNGAGPVVNTKFGIVFILALLSLFHTDFL